ncbi:MAG: diacylglycerol kinase family protein [bacterium]
MNPLWIVNPSAGRGRGARVAADLRGRLAARSLDGDIVQTSGPWDAVRLAREAAERGAPLAVAVGGDGTAHEVVNGLAGTETTFGLVPVGSGNDLALALGVPSTVDAALDVIAARRERRIDLGRFDDDRYFANSLGLGFEAQVTIESRKVRGLSGFAIYLWAVVRALAKLRCPDLRLVVDGQEIVGRRLLVCIGNGPRVGGGFLLTPDATNADGLLDLCIVDAMGRLRVLRTLPKAISGTHVSLPVIRMMRGRTIEIESKEGFPFHADGEVIDVARRRLRIEVRAAMLKVLSGESPGGPA